MGTYVQGALAIISLLLMASPAFAAAVDDSLAVFDLEVRNLDKGVSRPLTEGIRREVAASGKYKVLEREAMENTLGERKERFAGCSSAICLFEARQMLGAGRILTGVIDFAGGTYTLSLLLVNTGNGKVEKA